MFNKERLTLIALTLVALLLAGCGLFGPKSFDIVVRIEPPVEGVKIFVDGMHKVTTEADGQVELNVKANAKLTAELEGYTFEPKENKVTEAGEYVFKIVDPGVKELVIVSVESKRFDFYLGEAPEFEELKLPEKVEVTLDNGIPAILEVTWQEGDYDPKKADVYVIKGDLKLVEGIENPDRRQAEIEIEVIDAADRVERYLESLELIEDIEHYSEVAAIEELLSEAESAVSKIQDPITKVKLQADVLAEAARIKGILDRYVEAVQNALESDLELLEALGKFWDIDEKLITTYQSLMIAANNNGELETVHDIQTIIEKAPEEAAKAEAAAKIIEAAGKDSLIDFRNALIQYGEYLERVNLDHDENYTILKEYKEAIKVLVGLEAIQEAIDGVNREQAEEAVKAAVNSLERSDWTTANTLVAYMADDEFQDDLAKLDLVLEVVEAAQNGELGDLYDALEELELVEEDVEASLVMAYRDAIVDGMDQLKGQETISVVITKLEEIINEAEVIADPVDGIVTTDAKEYTAGDMIEITVKLLYEEQQAEEEPKYLYTLNGEYPAEITIGGRYYSKLLTFNNGKAVAEVRAEEAGDHQQEVKVSVKFEAEADWVDMTAEETVKIQAGDAVKLGVTGVAGGARLEAQDAYGNKVLTYEGPRTIKVTYEPKVTGFSAAGYKIDPDGQVAVVFSKGETEVSYGLFEFAPDLKDGKPYTFTFTVVEDGLTGTTDYTPE